MAKLAFLVCCICLFLSVSEGCRLTCGSDEGIGENLREHFSTCLQEKTKGRGGFNWAYLVNYAVWDDVWYLAASTFYCKGKSTDCWVEQADQFLKPTSPYLKPLKDCMREYAPTNVTNSAATAETAREPTCEKIENPVYVPMIYKKFTTLDRCPSSKFSYKSCLVSAALAVTRGAKIKADNPKFLPRYNFIELEKFILQHRSDCRITQVSRTSTYITRCASSAKATVSPPTTTTTVKPKIPPLKPKSGSGMVVRGKRALTLAELMEQLKGGQLNIRLSSSGQARILPSGPLTPAIATSFKCLGLKLQTLLRPNSILSSATSKCNSDIVNKPPITHRVSTSFRVAEAPKKEPGMVGKCGADDEWTPWYNHDSPTKGSGDLEYFSRIRSRNSRDVCFRPSAVQALVADTEKPYTYAREVVSVSPMMGLSCYNYKQRDKKCFDYKVRFCCPKL